ncbi:DUF4259 domain-containing protein [Paenarthrobacter sp. RAF54_2]|uniref:DUF4259 domain-containing protein n=1 Tax=Paenarthrobacter sp. RAF54_2 TaxID=3233061 RepID=UPI003F9A3EC0
MGTWSPGPFGNDEALDWFGDLREAPEAMPFIEETLTNGSTESIIASGAVLAVLSGHLHTDVHPNVIEWCAGRPAPSSALKLGAADAIQAVIDDPEVDGHDTWAELGEDDDDYIGWIANLESIQAVLRQSD